MEGMKRRGKHVRGTGKEGGGGRVCKSQGIGADGWLEEEDDGYSPRENDGILSSQKQKIIL